LPLNKVKALGEELDILFTGEIIDMLSLFNELGVLIYLTSTNALRNVVTKDPQWLLDCLSKVIRDDQLHRFNLEEIEKRGLSSEVDTLFKRAIVSKDLLEFLWKPDEVDFLLDLMKRTLLLSDWIVSIEHEKQYLVPSLLQDLDIVVSKHEYQVLYHFEGGVLPTGVFERLICLAVAHSIHSFPSESPVLSRNQCRLWMSDDLVSLQCEDGSIVCSFKNADIATSLIRMLSSMLGKIQSDVMNGKLKWCISVRKHGTSFMRIEEAQRRNVSPWVSKSTTVEVLTPNSSKDLDLDSFLSGLGR